MSNDAIGWHSDHAAAFDSNYRRSRAFKEREAVWTALIGAHGHPDADVLDAGCGSGVFSFIAARSVRSVLGIDGSAEMIAICNARGSEPATANIAFEVARLDDFIARGEGRFDLVLCSSVLEYVDDFWRTLEGLRGMLKPGGVLIFSMPNGMSLYRRLERLIYAVSGRPSYYAHVRHVPTPQAVASGLALRNLEILTMRFYARVPVVSPMAQISGRADLAHNLFVVACRPRK